MRNVGGAVLGWVVTAACVASLMALLRSVLGAEGSFRPGSPDVTPALALGSLAAGLPAAVVGGVVCAKVAADRRGEWMLVALVAVLGVANALYLHQAPVADGVLPEGVATMEAAGSAREPGWVSWLNPVVGVVGILLGARLARRRN